MKREASHSTENALSMHSTEAEEQSEFYRQYIQRQQGDLAEDRIRKIVHALPERVDSVLDIGCGRGTLLGIIRNLRRPSRLVGVDVASDTASYMEKLGMQGYAADASAGLSFADASFDVVVCGEVIEHVVNTDRLVAEVYRVLRPGGVMILTTPNLAYAINRIVLLLGLQPLFTETSLQRNMGRRWKLLGQGGTTQGHLKIFTLGALRELIAAAGFSDVRVQGYRFFQKGVTGLVDRILSSRASLAAGFVMRATKEHNS